MLSRVQHVPPERGARFRPVVDVLERADREIVFQRDDALVAFRELERFAKSVGGVIAIGNVDDAHR